MQSTHDCSNDEVRARSSSALSSHSQTHPVNCESGKKQDAKAIKKPYDNAYNYSNHQEIKKRNCFAEVTDRQVGSKVSVIVSKR